MADTDYIILPKPSVIILPGNSLWNGVSTGEINFGSIVNIYGTSDKYAVGDNVAYITEGQKLINISRYQYAVIDEKNILYAEETPV